MYYEEKVIDGVLCWRTSPHDPWEQKTLKQLTAILVNLKEKINTGKYEHICPICNCTFFGYKYSLVCNDCTKAANLGEIKL